MFTFSRRTRTAHSQGSKFLQVEVLESRVTPSTLGFEGNTVAADYVWPNTATVLYPSGNAVVGPGIEFSDIGGFGIGRSPSVDISDTNILITHPAGWTFNVVNPKTYDGWIVRDVLSAIPPITGASLAATNIPGYDGSQLTFDIDRVFVNLLGFSSLAPGSFISIDVTFAPDIAMQSAQLQAGNTVQFTYATTGNPGPFEVGLYRSTDGVTYNPADLIASRTVTPSPTNPQTPGTFTLSSPWTPDPSKPYLLVLADPPSAGKPKGDILETNDTDPATNSNGNNAASIQLPDLAPTFHNPDPAAADLLHKLIYRGQTLAAPLFMENVGGNATGTVNIEYYLSTSSSPSVDGPGNYLLSTSSSVPVSIGA